MARKDVINIVLEESGYNPERFAIEWVSGAEAARFSEKVTEFVDRIKKLGPVKEKTSSEAV